MIQPVINLNQLIWLSKSILFFADLNEQQIERKIEITHELIDAIVVLEPGLSRMRGMLLFDLQAAMAMQAKLDFEAERITKERAQVTMFCCFLIFSFILEYNFFKC